jgi:hypothetical protein
LGSHIPNARLWYKPDILYDFRQDIFGLRSGRSLRLVIARKFAGHIQSHSRSGTKQLGIEDGVLERSGNDHRYRKRRSFVVNPMDSQTQETSLISN